MREMIRKAQDKDLRALTDLYNYYIEHTAITFDVEPFTLEMREEWYRHYNLTPHYLLYVAEQDHEILGYASSSRFNPKAAFQTSVETSIYLQPGKTGNGVGSRLYARLFEELKHADVHRAYAGITFPNPVSFAFHQKFEFKPAAVFHQVGRKFGKYHDVHWLEKRLDQDLNVSG